MYTLGKTLTDYQILGAAANRKFSWTFLPSLKHPYFLQKVICKAPPPTQKINNKKITTSHLFRTYHDMTAECTYVGQITGSVNRQPPKYLLPFYVSLLICGMLSFLSFYVSLFICGGSVSYRSMYVYLPVVALFPIVLCKFIYLLGNLFLIVPCKFIYLGGSLWNSKSVSHNSM